MSEEDLFYKDVEGRKEKETRGEKISKTFSLLLGLMILIGLLFTLLGILR